MPRDWNLERSKLVLKIPIYQLHYNNEVPYNYIRYYVRLILHVAPAREKLYPVYSYLYKVLIEV